jgi:hypothetical protein
MCERESSVLVRLWCRVFGHGRFEVSRDLGSDATSQTIEMCCARCGHTEVVTHFQIMDLQYPAVWTRERIEKAKLEMPEEGSYSMSIQNKPKDKV